MEVEDRWEKGYKNAFASAHKPWIFNNRKAPASVQTMGQREQMMAGRCKITWYQEEMLARISMNS